ALYLLRLQGVAYGLGYSVGRDARRGSSMTELRAKAAIILVGQRLTFWEFLASSLVAYGVAGIAVYVGGLLGALASSMIGTATTAFLMYGLLLFGLQRPRTALIVISIAAAIHVSLLRAHVPAGLGWLLCSKPGLHWMEDHVF